MLSIRLLQNQATISDSLDSCFDLVSKWDDVFAAHDELVQKKSILDEHGLCKATAALYASNPILVGFLDTDETRDLLDPAKFDHMPQQSDMVQQISTFLKGEVRPRQDLQREFVEDVFTSFDVAQQTLSESVKMSREFLLASRQELSNSSKEGIPAKMREYSLGTFPASDRWTFEVTEDEEGNKPALTLFDLHLTREDIIAAIDDALSASKMITRNGPYFSQRPEECLAQLHEFRVLSNKIQKDLIGVMAVVCGFRACC